MRRVIVALSPPEIIIEITTSSSDVMNARNAPVCIENFTCGTVIVHKATARDAPILRAASS